MKTLILVPGFRGFLSPIGKTVRKALKDNAALITFDIDRAVSLYEGGRVNRVIIVMGAKKSGGMIHPMAAYEYLKSKGIEATVVDTVDWSVKGQIVLEPQYIHETMLSLCS